MLSPTMTQHFPNQGQNINTPNKHKWKGIIYASQISNFVIFAQKLQQKFKYPFRFVDGVALHHL
jgi:hypothetical protein